MKKKKNKKKKKYIIIGIIIGICFLFGITSHFIDDDKKLNVFERVIKDTTTFVEKIVGYPFKIVKNEIDVHNKSKKIYKKYNKLKEKVDKIESYEARIIELESIIDDLKKELDLNSTLSEYTYVNATVVSRNRNYWFNDLTIDKGIKNGVNNGDAVITSTGLIGKIVSAGNYSSTVKLLTSGDIKNKISIKIINEDNSYSGLLVGYDSKKNVYKVEGVSDIEEVEVGYMVTTTGFTDNFPSGLLIGKVSKIVKDEYDLTAIVEVTPSTNFNDINIVTVLNREADTK